MTGKERTWQLIEARRKGFTPEERTGLFNATLTHKDADAIEKANLKRQRKLERNLRNEAKR